MPLPLIGWNACKTSSDWSESNWNFWYSSSLIGWIACKTSPYWSESNRNFWYFPSLIGWIACKTSSHWSVPGPQAIKLSGNPPSSYWSNCMQNLSHWSIPETRAVEPAKYSPSSFWLKCIQNLSPHFLFREQKNILGILLLWLVGFNAKPHLIGQYRVHKPLVIWSSGPLLVVLHVKLPFIGQYLGSEP